MWKNFTFVFLIWVGLQITILENKQKLNQCGNILEVVTTAKANFGQLVEKCQTCLFQKDFSSVTFPGGSTDHGIKKIVPAPCHRNGADAKIFYLTQVRSLSTFFTDSTDWGKVSRKKVAVLLDFVQIRGGGRPCPIFLSTFHKLYLLGQFWDGEARVGRPLPKFSLKKSGTSCPN